MLAGLKALLEHGVRLNLVGDRYPKGVAEHELTEDLASVAGQRQAQQRLRVVPVPERAPSIHYQILSVYCVLRNFGRRTHENCDSTSPPARIQRIDGYAVAPGMGRKRTDQRSLPSSL